MKKITFLILMGLLWSMTGFSQIVIGAQDGVTSYMPIYSCYEYSYVQQLIYQDEINAAGDITSISFYFDGTSSSSNSSSSDWTVYLGQTTKTEFASNTDWVPSTDLTQVFTGTVTYPAAGNQMVITFDTPFTYDNTENLVFAVDENQPGYDCSNSFGKTEDLGVARGIYFRSDTDNPDPTSPPEAYDTLNFINNVILGGIQQSCPAPTDLVVADITETEATVSWTEIASANEWEVVYGPIGFDPLTEGDTVTVNDNPTTTLTGLDSGITYDFYVRAVCGPSDLSSLVGPTSFDTLCVTSQVPYSLTFESGASCVSYENLGLGQGWQIVTDDNSGFTGTYARYYYSSAVANAWLYTNAIALTAGVQYQLTYTYGNNSTTYVEKMKVAYGTSNSAAAMTNELANYPSINDKTPHTETVYFTAATTDVYYFGFQAYSIANQYFLQLDNISVEEAPLCLPPTALTVDAVTEDTATVSWTSSGTETEWEVLYGEVGFDPTTEGTPVAVNTDPETTITGLDANTPYEFYVTAICGVGEESEMAGPKAFTTACTATTVPYLLDFETAIVPELPNCTSRENVGTGNNWVTGTHNNGGLSGNVLRYAFNSTNAANAWFYTQGIEMQAGVDYQILYSYDASSSFPEKLKVAYGTSPDATAMTEELANYPNIVGPEDEMVSFTVAADGVYYFGFNVYSDADQNNLYVDNINIIVAPTCGIPTALMVSNLTQDSATLSWTAGASETEWEVLYGEAGFDPTTEGTPVAVNTDPETTITGLDANTQYEFYVTAICGVGDESEMAGPEAFTTTCDATSVPYTLDFEEVTIPALPDCTSVQNVGAGNNWETATSGDHGFDSNVLRYKWNTTNAADTWFYTQGIDLVAGTEYQISYKYGNNAAAAFVESMKVAYGTSPDAAAMTNELANYPSIAGGNPTLENITFEVPADGVYYFGFNAYSIADQFYLYLDDINIAESVDCEAVTDVAVSDITTTTVTVSWTASASALEGYVVDVFEGGVDPQTGTPVTTQNVAAGTTTANIAGLDANTSYDVYVTSNCAVGNTVMSDGVNFITMPLGLNDNNLGQVSYFPNPVKDQLTVTAVNKIENITVYNLLGQQLIQVQPQGTNVIVDMASLPTGTYILKASVEGAVSTFKVVKQ